MKKALITTVAMAMMNMAVAQSDIANFFSQLNTFSANFSQTVEQDGTVVQQSQGTVWLKKPLKFRWDYQTPENMQLLSDGTDFYHYDIELAQATVKPVEEVTGSALTTLLNDKNQLDKVFTVKSFAAPAVKKRFPEQAQQWLHNADVFYELTAKDKTADDANPTLVIIGLTSQRQLSVFYAEDAYGKNTFVFKDIKQNANIANNQFTFKAPQGVDVLGQ